MAGDQPQIQSQLGHNLKQVLAGLQELAEQGIDLSEVPVNHFLCDLDFERSKGIDHESLELFLVDELVLVVGVFFGLLQSVTEEV